EDAVRVEVSGDVAVGSGYLDSGRPCAGRGMPRGWRYLVTLRRGRDTSIREGAARVEVSGDVGAAGDHLDPMVEFDLRGIARTAIRCGTNIEESTPLY
ncbi:hypothetical protein, partial [Nostocoides japonicum]|uniref:hypothetical protein n=1 Tax=Nostocoides japonicum TaxID=99481 RepID=UPI001F3D0C08